MASSETSVLDGIRPGPTTSMSSAGFQLDNLRIGVRMAIVLTLPIVLSLWLGSEAILKARKVWVEQEKLGDLAVLATKISQTVHQLQIERGMSAGFINSKGHSFASELPKQLGATDGDRNSMNSVFARLDAATNGDELVQLVSSATKALAGLDTMRAQVKSRQVTVAQMAQYYTPTIAKLLSVIEYMGSHNSHAAVGNMITAYTAFLHGKESAGLERAMGAAGFGGGYFAPAIYQKFIGLIAAQDSYFSVFRNYASTGQIAFFEQTVSGAVVDEVDRLQRVARDSESTGDTGGITGPQWFAAITKKIELLKRVEDRIAGDLVARTESLGANARSSFWIRIAAVGGLTAFTLFFAVYMVRGIAGPLTRLTNVTTRLADGDTSSPIDLRVSADEVGTLVKAIKVFRENLIQTDRLQAEQRDAEKKAQDTERRREAEMRDAERAEVEKREADATERQKRADRLEEIIAAFDTQITSVVESLSSAATEMQSSAEAMSATADQTSRQATAVAAASEEATTNVQTVASSAEELSASIEEISRQVTQSNQIAQNAVEEARQTNAKVEGLADAAQKIGDVVNLINDIAAQTNLLALNATIEAARAGDAGKGFAVVASEVKSLATQTGKATEEIAAQITAIQGATGEAVQAIQGIGITIGQLGEIATSVSTAVTQQGSATREIASSVQQAAAGTQEVSGNIAQVTQAAGDAQTSSGHMLGAAKELAQQGEMLRKEVDKFLHEIRAA